MLIYDSFVACCHHFDKYIPLKWCHNEFLFHRFCFKGKDFPSIQDFGILGPELGTQMVVEILTQLKFSGPFGKPVGNSTHQCTKMNGVWTGKKNSLSSHPQLTDLVSYVATIQMIYLPISHQVPDLLTYLHSTYSPSLPTPVDTQIV